jgi:hypothetical protein
VTRPLPTTERAGPQAPALRQTWQRPNLTVQSARATAGKLGSEEDELTMTDNYAD